MTLRQFAIGAVALVALGWLGKCAIERSAKNAVLSEIRRDSLTADVGKADSVLRVVDTVRTRDLLRYTVLRRDTLRYHDTVWVKETLDAADVALRSCSAAVSSCKLAIAARDSLLGELRRPPYVPRFTYSATLAYDPLRGEALLRGGPEIRLFWGLTAVAEAEARQSLAEGARGAVRVGLKKQF